MAANTLIIPITVPSNPSKGVVAAIVPRAFRYRSRPCTTCRPDSSTASRTRSGSLSAQASPAARTLPKAEPRRNAATRSASKRPCIRARSTSAAKPEGVTTARRSAKERSRIMATDSTEHTRMGNISHPPVRINSNITDRLPGEWSKKIRH